MNRQHFKSIQTRKNPNPTFQPHLQSHSCYHMNVHCLTMRNLISPCWCYSRNFIIDVCLCHHKRVWEPLVKVGLAADGKPLAEALMMTRPPCRGRAGKGRLGSVALGRLGYETLGSCEHRHLGSCKEQKTRAVWMWLGALLFWGRHLVG